MDRSLRDVAIRLGLVKKRPSFQELLLSLDPKQREFHSTREILTLEGVEAEGLEDILDPPEGLEDILDPPEDPLVRWLLDGLEELNRSDD